MSIQETLGEALAAHQRGQTDKAHELYQEVLSRQPNHPDALHLLGVLASQANDHQKAQELIRRAIVLNPSAAHYHDNLGVALAADGQADAAIVAHRQAVALKPDFSAAFVHLGNALKSTGKTEEAIASYRRAIEINPQYADACYCLGICLFSLDRLVESEAAYWQAIVADPGYVEAYNNVGACQFEQGRFEEALAAYQQALKLKPDHLNAHTNMGNAYRALGAFEESRRWFAMALKLDPGSALAHWNLALLMLMKGEFEKGWDEYEWRWKVEHFDLPDLTQPRWEGEDLQGRTILLYGEQGVGDAIQFIRYVPAVARRGGRILIMCHKHLHRLFARMPGVARCASLDEEIPRHDVQCPLISLPRVLGTRLDTIPGEVPYLSADPALVEQWAHRLPADGRLKVGLCWGNRPNPRDRCPRPQAWAPLAEIGDVWFCSLQKETVGNHVPDVPPGLQLLGSSRELNDFADTAALIAHCDLVISVDTAVAHLAGAMGKPTWVPLKYVPDWRWLWERSDSPWYPTMKLYRQPKLGDWGTPIARITQDLRTWASR